MNLEEVLKEELGLIRINKQDKSEINKIVNLVINAINSKIKKLKINAEVFVGGSFAKNTLIKKEIYDVDLFLRFDQKYSEQEIQSNFKKIFFWFKIPKNQAKVKLIHGSRDYYQILLKKPKNICIEVIPTLKITKSYQARNVTDLSYFHVNYVKKQLKSRPELNDEILLMKAFCHGQKCYGAESYVSGFSGYVIELLVLHYGSFEKVLRELAGYSQRMIIDPAGYYKTVEEVIRSLNPSKIHSPIILIDPTFKERNVTSALSKDTFNRFKFAIKEFLKSPSIDFFINKPTDISEFKKMSWDHEGIFSIFEIRTNKQAGDIAGTKLLKFSKFLNSEISKSFDIIKMDFEYDNKKNAKIYYILKNKKEIIITGPQIKYKEAVDNFKKVHPVWYIQNNHILSARPANISAKDFLKRFKKSYRKTIKDMSIRKIKLVKV